MHTKAEILNAIDRDPEEACMLLLDFIEKIFESDEDEAVDLKNEYYSERTLVSFLEYEEMQGVDELDFFDRYDKWEENRGYKIQP